MPLRNGHTIILYTVVDIILQLKAVTLINTNNKICISLFKKVLRFFSVLDSHIQAEIAIFRYKTLFIILVYWISHSLLNRPAEILTSCNA